MPRLFFKLHEGLQLEFLNKAFSFNPHNSFVYVKHLVCFYKNIAFMHVLQQTTLPQTLTRENNKIKHCVNIMR